MDRRARGGLFPSTIKIKSMYTGRQTLWHCFQILFLHEILLHFSNVVDSKGPDSTKFPVHLPQLFILVA